MSIARLLALFALLGFVSAHAAAPLASPDDDRFAKHARPDAGRALVYVYSSAPNDAPATAITLNRRDSASLYPRTFNLWNVAPGDVELRAAGSGASTTLTATARRVYYVELGHSSSGVTLRVVPFATGRANMQRTQLIAKPGAAPKREAPRPRAAAPSRPPEPSRVVLALKLGSLKPAKATQTIVGNEQRFDSASSVYSLEGELFLRPELALSAEFIGYSNDYTTVSNSTTGETDTTVVMLSVKRYFNVGSAWQPYVGAGLGGAGTDFNGSVSGSTGGFAMQLVAGLQWRVGKLGWRAEYKHLNADTEDDNGQKIDMSGSGVFFGAGLHF